MMIFENSAEKEFKGFLRCDCGLTFNLMPQLSLADIVADPLAVSEA